MRFVVIISTAIFLLVTVAFLIDPETHVGSNCIQVRTASVCR